MRLKLDENLGQQPLELFLEAGYDGRGEGDGRVIPGNDGFFQRAHKY